MTPDMSGTYGLTSVEAVAFGNNSLLHVKGHPSSGINQLFEVMIFMDYYDDWIDKMHCGDISSACYITVLFISLWLSWPRQGINVLLCPQDILYNGISRVQISMQFWTFEFIGPIILQRLSGC